MERSHARAGVPQPPRKRIAAQGSEPFIVSRGPVERQGGQEDLSSAFRMEPAGRPISMEFGAIRLARFARRYCALLAGAQNPIHPTKAAIALTTFKRVYGHRAGV